ncbi:MAG: CarD family transcriptional regulator, partial [Bacilli bacterium]|nr:CarD family transcriptional regulator [Bacilli bacterium]
MNLFDKLKNSKAIPPFLSRKGHFVVDSSIGIALLTAATYRETHEQYLIVASNLYQAQKIYSLISLFVDSKDIYLFPSDELIRAENMVQSKEMVAQRLFALSKIVTGQAQIVIANVASATRYLPSPSLFKEQIISLEVSKSYDLSELKKQLVRNGYSLVNKIDQSLQFAIRGDILDIFSVNNDFPVRIEFYGDEIESMRYFDIATQTSTTSIKNTIVLPASDIILGSEELKNGPDKLLDILQSDEKHISRGDFETLRDNLTEDIDKIMSFDSSQRIYKYYGQLLEKPFSLFDYCKPFTTIFVEKESIIQSNELLLKESNNYLGELFEKRLAISHLSFYQDINRLSLFSGNNIITTSEFFTHPDDIPFSLKNVPFQASKTVDMFSIIQSYLNEDYKIVLSLSKNEHINTAQEGLYKLGQRCEIVHEFSLPKTKVGLTALSLPQGFVLPDEKIVYLTSAELFNDRVKTARFDSRFKEATILKSYEDLEPGDYVVHEYQGIGQFVELINLEVDNIHRDYLKIAYHGGELLYVPLSQFQLVRKYLGKEGSAPRLSRLHSKDWENTKKKIKQRVNDLAERLMHLYIERRPTRRIDSLRGVSIDAHRRLGC